MGSDITLTCSSEEGIPRPTYLWEKLDNVPKLPPTATQGACSVDYPLISQVTAWAFLCLSHQRWHGSLSVCYHLHGHFIGTKIPRARGGLGTLQWPLQFSCFFGTGTCSPLKNKDLVEWERENMVARCWHVAGHFSCQLTSILNQMKG